MGVYIPVTKKKQHESSCGQRKASGPVSKRIPSCLLIKQAAGPAVLALGRHQTCKYQQRLPRQRPSGECIGSLLEVPEEAATCLTIVAPRTPVRTR